LGLVAILVIMSVLTFKTAVILNIMYMLLMSQDSVCLIETLNLSTEIKSVMNFESKNVYRFVAYVIFVFFTVPGMDVKEKALFVCAAFMHKPV
jgi:hypothetical protein